MEQDKIIKVYIRIMLYQDLYYKIQEEKELLLIIRSIDINPKEARHIICRFYFSLISDRKNDFDEEIQLLSNNQKISHKN